MYHEILFYISDSRLHLSGTPVTKLFGDLTF